MITILVKIYYFSKFSKYRLERVTEFMLHSSLHIFVEIPGRDFKKHGVVVGWLRLETEMLQVDFLRLRVFQYFIILLFSRTYSSMLTAIPTDRLIRLLSK